ncbi:hypothetical protein T06_2760 [Trichinella sp. T6]|nr:hypothetical protein T06_2760 [Trichinella sp. T6]
MFARSISASNTEQAYAWPAYYLFNEMRNTFHTC